VFTLRIVVKIIDKGFLYYKLANCQTYLIKQIQSGNGAVLQKGGQGVHCIWTYLVVFIAYLIMPGVISPRIVHPSAG
jgi:hypothetical protein